MAKRPSTPRFTSFKGTFRFPKLSAPDYGTKDYPNKDGSYNVQLVGRLDDPEVQAMLAKLEPLYNAVVAQADAEFKKLKPETRKKLKSVTVNPLYTELLDKETEEPTGEVAFKVSMSASGEYGEHHPKAGQRWTAKPTVFDAKGTELKVVPEIWGGTVGKVSFEVPGTIKGFDGPGYFIPGTGIAGLKLKLRAVQIIELVQGGAKSASGEGFGEEDGYEGSNAEVPAASTDDPGPAGDAGDGDF